MLCFVLKIALHHAVLLLRKGYQIHMYVIHICAGSAAGVGQQGLGYQGPFLHIRNITIVTKQQD